MAAAVAALTTNSSSDATVSTALDPDFPAVLRTKKILIATESYGPVNGVSRTTGELIAYLRRNGANVAVVAPEYHGKLLCGEKDASSEQRESIINQDFVQFWIGKLQRLASRGIGGAWNLHHEQPQQDSKDAAAPSVPVAAGQAPPHVLNSKRTEASFGIKAQQKAPWNPELRLSGVSLPYNPDLKVPYPFRMSSVYRKTLKPDVVYLASPATLGVSLLLQLTQLKNPPPIMANYQTDLGHYAKVLFPRLMTEYALWFLAFVDGTIFSLPSVKKVFFPSGYIGDYLRSVGATASRLEQLGRGVDTTLFNPSRRDETFRKSIAPNGEIVFCCISRVAPEKGYDFLAKAAHKLKESGLPFKLLIVGGNKNPVVENTVKSYFAGLDDNVIFAGVLRGDALARAYASADIFLHCSISETFGLVVLESMASGVPVIARAEGGPAETVKHGKTGFLTEPHDLDDFVKRARQLATDRDLLTRMIADARQQALDTTWDKINNRAARRIAEAIASAPPETSVEEKGAFMNALATTRGMILIYAFWLFGIVPILVMGYLHSLLG